MGWRTGGQTCILQHRFCRLLRLHLKWQLRGNDLVRMNLEMMVLQIHWTVESYEICFFPPKSIFIHFMYWNSISLPFFSPIFAIGSFSERALCFSYVLLAEQGAIAPVANSVMDAKKYLFHLIFTVHIME